MELLLEERLIGSLNTSTIQEPPPDPLDISKSNLAQSATFTKSLFAGGMTYFQWFKNRFVLDKEKVIDALISGFESNYFLEEDVVQNIQAINKENVTKKKPPLPSIQQMHLFLICLEEMDVYIQSYNQIQLQ